jgi:hypothetical protein
MMAEVNSDEMCSIIAAMIARRKQEQTMTDVNNDDDDDGDKSMATQEKISPRDVRSFTFLPDTTTKEDDKGEDTGIIRKGDNDDDAAAAATAKGQDGDQLMTPTAAATKSKGIAMMSGGVLEEYAITFLRDVLRHSVTFTQNAYDMRVQEWM